MRLKHTLYLSFLFFSVLLLTATPDALGQATFSTARHETLPQNQIDVTFSQNVTLPGGAPFSTAGWFVTINGANVPVTSISPFGPTTVRVTFDASGIAGHGGVQQFVKPGETLRVRYDGSGILTSAGGVTAFGVQQSLNQTTFSCTEVLFLQQGLIPTRSADVCAPVIMDFYQWQYRMSLRLLNSSNFTAANFQYNFVWGDGASQQLNPYRSDATGTASGTFIDNVGFGGNPQGIWTARPTKNYPATVTPAPDCSWNVNVTPFYIGGGSCPGITQTTTFATYDTDNANSGVLNLPPSVPGSDLVCLGDNVNMLFTDATQLNCRVAFEPTLPNDQARHIRIVYGSTNNGAPGNIPDIRVTLPASLGGGTTQVTNNNATGTLVAGAFTPTSVGAADFNGVIALPTPVTAATALAYMGQITTTLTNNQAVGQRFYVRLDYWDICNPYNAGNPNSPAPVSIENFVQIIQSPNPPTVNNPVLCETATDGSFNITATGTGAGTLTYTWYRDAALTQVLQGPSTDNTFNPVTEGPTPRITKAVTGSQTFNRFVTVTQGSNNCTSPPQTITIRIDDQNTAGAIAHPLGASPITVCSGTNPAAFTSVTPGTGGGPDGPDAGTDGDFVYQWQSATNAAFTAGVTNIVGATAATFDPPAVTSTIYYRRQVLSGNCLAVNSGIIGFLVDTPVGGGTIAAAQTICANPGNPANLTSTAGATGGSNTGTYNYQWENSTDGVSFNTIGGATVATYNPPAGVTQTTHYRRRVTSGVCSADGPDAGTDPDNLAYSNVIVVTVHQENNPGTIGNPQTICRNDDPAALTNVTAASGGDGTNYVYQWQSASDAAFTVGVTDMPGANALTFNPGTLTATTFYRRRVRSPGPVTTTCSEAFTNVVAITVNQPPTAADPTGGGSVCSGNPAPDIEWVLTGSGPFQVTYTITQNPGPGETISTIGPVAVATSPFVVTAPNPAGAAGDVFHYKITVLEDNNSCSTPAATLSGLDPGIVSIGGTAPAFNTAPSLATGEVCVGVPATDTTNPELSFALSTPEAGNYILTYRVDGGGNRTKTFTVNTGTGVVTTPLVFTDTPDNEFNNTTPSPHVLRIVSIQSPSGCLTAFTNELDYIVRPLPVISTQPTDEEVCVGGNTSYTVAATTAGATSTNIQWQVSTTGAGGTFTDLANVAPYSDVTTATLSITGTPAGLNGNFYRAVVTGVFPSTFSCPVNSTAVELTVHPYATITAQPPTRELCSGETTTFGVTANVAAPSTITGYQWQISTTGPTGTYTDLTNVAPYSNVTTATMTITGATTALSGNHYRVLITTTGTCALPSNPGELIVNPNPVSNAISPIVCEDILHVVGSPSLGTGQATNVDLNQFSALLADLPGAPVEVPAGFEVLYFQDAGYTTQITTPTTITNNEQIFTRVRNTTTGCFTNRMITFTLRQQPVPTSITDQVCEDNPPGSNAATGIDLTAYETTVTGGAANRTVEWYTDPSLALAALIPSGGLPNEDQNYSISATTTFFAKVINTTAGEPGCHSVAELELEYQPRPNANTIRDGAGVAPGATYTVCASNNLVFLQIDPTLNPGATYNWNVPASPPLPTDPGYFELLTGTNGFFIILRFPSLIASPGLPISVTESLGTAGCEGTPINISVIVEGSPAAPTITGPGTVCSNSSVVYSVPFVAGDTYSWTVPPGATITSFPITNTITVQMSTVSGNVTVTVANSTGCVAPPSTPLPVTVVTRPAMTSVAAAALCSGQAPDDVLTFAATLGGTTYRWEVISISGFVSGASVGDTDGSLPGSNTPGAANIDSRTLTNTSGVSAAVIYRVTPVSPPTAGVYCEGNPQNVTITIRPEPELVLTPKTVCSDEPANYEIKLATVGLPTGTQFNWAAPVMSDGSTQGTAGTNIPAGAAGTIHINDAFVNTSAGTITATYTITATSGAGCSSNQPVADRQVVITINPKPLVSTTLDDTICSDEALALTLNIEPGSTAAGSYDIISRTVDPLLTALPGNATVPQSNVTAAYLANDRFTNTSGGPLLVTYVVSARGTAGLGSCQGPTQLITITINSGPTTSPVTDEVCSNTAGGDTYVEDLTSLESQVNPDGTLTFEWYTDAAATLPIATPTAYPLQDGVPVYVKVHNGPGTCAKIQAVEYVVNPTPAVTASITSNYNGVNVRCVGSADGTITANVATLGSPNYSYSIDGSNFFTGRIFNGLSAAGNPYVVTVRDARGCTATSAPMNLVAPAALTATPAITSNFNGQHIECQGDNNGEVTVTAGGGVGLVATDYVYAILELPGNTTGATTGVFTGLTAGEYTFVVRDANNCPVTSSSITLMDPPAITATAVLTTPVSCNGVADGVITVTAAGGTLTGPDYTYTLFPGGTSNTTGVFSGLAAGTYTVNVEDDNGCVKTSNNVTVTQPSPLTAFASVTSSHPGGSQISCPGADDAEITVTANGGNGGYSYVLVEDPANTTGNATGIYTGMGPGTYTVSVTDAQLCTVVTVAVIITEPTPLNANGVVSFAISCNGGSDGEIRISSTGGTGAYTFTMISPAVSSNATGIFSALAQGTYDFEVRDLNNCTDVVQVVLDEPTAVTASAVVQTPYNGAQISCNGASDGVITVTASGGTGALTYVFDQFPANLTGRTTGVFTGVPPGTGYTFSVRDAKNCTAPVTTPVDVVQPLVITASAAVTSDYNGEDISCPTSTDGIITVTASGGTGALTYRLDQAPLNLTGAATGIFTGVGAGSYTVTVRDANSCFDITDPITITPPLSVTASAAVASPYNGRQISCNGASDGILTVTAAGGVTPYAYVLNEIPGNVTGAVNGIFTGLPAGTYTVNVTDDNGCPVVTLPVTISEPTPVAGTSNVTSNYNGQQLRCVGASDGIIRVTGSGGTGPYNFISIEVPGNVTGLTTGIFTGLPAGSYTFTVEDNNGCTFLTPAVVISPPVPLTASALVTSDYHGSQISCTGAADGTITITATGGTGALTYVFVENPANTTGATSGMFTGIAAGGPYTFLVTDANTCNVTTVGVSITEPDPIAASAAVTSDHNGEHITCPTATDGVITVTASGGTGVYTYRLDQSPLNTTGNSTGIYSNVGAGTYTVTVRDENGCFVVTTPPVTVVPPPPVTATVSVTSDHNGQDISCNGASDGELTVIPGGGVGSYTFLLDQIPANATGAGTGIFTGVPAGTYTVTVRDGNNCPVTTTPVTITEPAVLGASAAVTSNYNGQQISCNGASDGRITITVSGGTGPFAFTSVEVPGNVTGASSGIFTGLPAGNYTFDVTDVNSCATTTAQVTISEPALMVATLAVTSDYNGRDVSCAGASDGILTVSVTVPGTGASTFTIDQIPTNASGRFSGVFTGVPPGNYTVTVRDANNCTIITNAVTVDPTDPIIANAVVTKNVNCFAEANGIVTVTASGGTGSLEYLLIQDASNFTGQFSGVFTGLRAGSYTVRVTDDNTCFVTTTSVTVTQPANLTITIAKLSPYNGFDLSCAGASDGEIHVTSTAGGTGPYTYVLDGFPGNTTGATSGIFTGLSAGLYTITVTDNNTGDPFGACTRQSLPVFINNPIDLSVNLVGMSAQICIGDDPGVINQISPPVGGIGVYTYQWQDSIAGGAWADIGGAVDPTFDPPVIAQTTYYRRILSSGSCVPLVSDPVTITVNPLPEIANVTAPEFLCENQAMIVFYDFAPGQAPFFFSYTQETIDQGGAVIATKVVTNEISGDSKPVIQSPFTDDVRITVTGLRDFNGCVADPALFAPHQRYIEVLKTSAAFTATTATQCDGTPFDVQWDANPEVEYTFVWPEGPNATFGPGLNGPQTDSRILHSQNPTAVQTLPIIMTATNTLHLTNPAAPACGVVTHMENISLFPTIIPNIVVPIDSVCSGTPLSITNSTQGGVIHAWTVTDAGGAVLPAPLTRTGPLHSTETFMIHNQTNDNPAVYNIAYHIENSPANGSCSRDTTVTVVVFREAIAKIGAPKDPLTAIPLWTAPSDDITFNNATVPYDTDDFTYTWIISNNNPSTPADTLDGNNPAFRDPTYTFLNPGAGKRAILIVVNDLALAEGMPNGCATRDEFIFKIEVPPLTAVFDATPLAACLPTVVEVTNQSTGEFTSEWRVVNQTNNEIYLSQEFEPEFPITSPGRYTITLVVKNPYDATAEETATPVVVDVYANPVAAFITIPLEKVFVPDQEMRTDNGSASAFDPISSTRFPIEYRWYFGDGSDSVRTDIDINPNPVHGDLGHSPTHKYETEGSYQIALVALNRHDNKVGGHFFCRDTAYQMIQARASGTSKVPNAFTPNPGGPSGGVVTEDGTTINDVFLPITKGVKEFQMQIFDRWGNLVFESRQQNRGWDGYDRNGNLVPAGVYVYKLVLRMANDQRTTQVGDVTLIR